MTEQKEKELLKSTNNSGWPNLSQQDFMNGKQFDISNSRIYDISVTSKSNNGASKSS